MKIKIIIIFVFLFFFQKTSIAQNEVFFENSPNFISFHKEMRDLCMLYIDKANMLSRGEIEYIQKANPKVNMTNSEVKKYEDSLAFHLNNIQNKKEVEQNVYRLLDSMYTVFAKNKTNINAELQKIAVEDVSSRTLLGINEAVFEQKMTNIEKYLQAIFTEFYGKFGNFKKPPIGFEKSLENLDKKQDNYPKDSCRQDAFEHSLRAVMLYVNTQTRLYKTSKTPDEKRIMTRSVFHTDIMESVERCAVCLSKK